jgi:hypothetical protein
MEAPAVGESSERVTDGDTTEPIAPVTLQTTAIYIAVADQKRSEAIDSLNPYGG